MENSNEKQRLSKEDFGKLMFEQFLHDSIGIEAMRINEENQKNFKALIPNFTESNTLHYIVFDAAEGKVMILPFSFNAFTFPESRLRLLFPKGYQKYELPYTNMLGGFSEIQATTRSSIEGFKLRGDWIYGYAIIGQLNKITNRLHGLEFWEVLQILSTLEISANYSHFLFYPPC